MRLFGELGCASCHVPALPLARKLYTLALGGEAEPIQVDLEREGAGPIPPRSAVDGVRRLSLYSDLRRHAMGAELSEPADTDRVPGDPFLTPPLWGVARSRPYLQDGRAAILEAAILLHGGEALAARDAYAALSDSERGALRVFLTALTRQAVLEVP